LEDGVLSNIGNTRLRLMMSKKPMMRDIKSSSAAPVL